MIKSIDLLKDFGPSLKGKSLISSSSFSLNSEQKNAFELLKGPGNIFLTGSAGTGKSYLLRYFQNQVSSSVFPVVASTGAAAVLIRGRTFHSFFGLGIMAGGPEVTIEKACKSDRVKKRLNEIEGIIIDEVSMLSGMVLSVAEQIARKVREKKSPWGGLKIIVVGDFFQLPPVTRSGEKRDWVFRHPVWENSSFSPIVLNQVMRTQDEDFLKALNEVRIAKISNETHAFFESKVSLDLDDQFVGTRLYPKNTQVEYYNQKKLLEIQNPLHEFKTEYFGKNSDEVERAKKLFTFPEVLSIKEGCLVMITNNDPSMQWYNGTLGYVREIQASEIKVEKLFGKKLVCIRPVAQDYLGPNGEVAVTARNFPLRLGYAVTIHKAQGMTLDSLRTDLDGVWEHGQAYVALSRARSAQSLSLKNWSRSAVIADPEVVSFYWNLTC